MTNTANDIAELKARIAVLEEALVATMKIPTTIGYIEDRLEFLDARIAAVVAFAAAAMDSNTSKKDEILTRWLDKLAPALHEFASLKKEIREHAALVPYWVQTHKDRT